MTAVIVQALAPIFLILILGFVAGRKGLVDNRNVALLNVYVMDFALPAALFGATAQTSWSGILSQAPLVVVLVLCMWLTYALVYYGAVRLFRTSAQEAAVLALTVALPNYAALGLPILGSVLGESTATSLSVAVCIACGSVLMTPFCLLILEREKARASGEGQAAAGLGMLPTLMLRSASRPIVWAPLLGVVFAAIGLRMPAGLLGALRPLGLSATGAALFLTGVILSARRLRLTTSVTLGSLIKLLLQPALAWVLVLAFGLHGPAAVTPVLMIALAAGFFGVVFGNRYGVQSPDAEGVLLASSVLCVVSLPLFIGLTAAANG